MMKKIIALLLTILFGQIIYSCKHIDGCDDDTRDAPLSVFDSNFLITFKDKSTGDFLIKKSPGTYTPTDIKVFDEHQKEVRLYAQIYTENQKEHYVIYIPVLANRSLPEWGLMYNRNLYIT